MRLCAPALKKYFSTREEFCRSLQPSIEAKLRQCLRKRRALAVPAALGIIIVQHPFAVGGTDHPALAVDGEGLGFEARGQVVVGAGEAGAEVELPLEGGDA